MSADGREFACGPAKSGAGGSGRFGLPPYLDEGVPGRGLPLRSARSYDMGDGGGRESSEEFLDGELARVGEVLGGMYGRYEGASAPAGTR